MEKFYKEIMSQYRVRWGTSKDSEKIRKLLHDYGFKERFRGGEFRVIEHRGKIIGCVRLKYHGDCYELRAMCLIKKYRDEEFEKLLVDEAKKCVNGIIYAVTDRKKFFENLEFIDADWENVPPAILKQKKVGVNLMMYDARHPGDVLIEEIRLILDRDIEKTKKALEKVKITIPMKSHLIKIAEDFRLMAESYYKDALYFKKNGELVKALACINYAHGWLDAGARLGIFDVDEDSSLFTLAE